MSHFRIHAIHHASERQIPTGMFCVYCKPRDDWDMTRPSLSNRLMLGWRGNRPLHAVAVEDASDDETILITVYQPDPGQ